SGRKYGGLPSGNPKRLPVMDFGVGKWQVVTQAQIEGHSPRDFVGVLHVAIQRLAIDSAVKITPALQEENWLADHETGERIRDREGCENKKPVGGDTLQHVDVQVFVAASEFQFVPAMDPAQRSIVIIRIFKTIARSRDRIAHRSVTTDLHEGWPDSYVQTGVVTEAKS